MPTISLAPNLRVLLWADLPSAPWLISRRRCVFPLWKRKLEYDAPSTHVQEMLDHRLLPTHSVLFEYDGTEQSKRPRPLIRPESLMVGMPE